MIVRAERTHDCLRQVRFRYHLDTPVARALLSGLSDRAGLAVQELDVSHILPTARITFQARDPESAVMIAGALGLSYVTVTYARGDDLESWVARIEGALGCPG
jgi:hypothetical protein